LDSSACPRCRSAACRVSHLFSSRLSSDLLEAAAGRLYSSYLTEAARLALAGLGAIVLLLVLALRTPGRAQGEHEQQHDGTEPGRSEEHTSDSSHEWISCAVFRLKTEK